MAWQTGSMALFRLNGEVSSENPGAIQQLLAQLTGGQVTPTPAGLHVEGAMEGTDARDVNRRLLSALRRVEKRTRLRAEWTAGASSITYLSPSDPHKIHPATASGPCKTPAANALTCRVGCGCRLHDDQEQPQWDVMSF